MSTPTPDNYCTLPEALKTRDKSLNIIGMVTDYMAPIQTRGEDLVCTLRIQDPDHLSSYHDPNGLRVRYFGRAEDFLPKVKSIGDMVILRNVKIKEFRGELFASSVKSSTCVVIYCESVPKPPFQAAFGSERHLPHNATRYAAPPSIPEQIYVIHLKSALESFGLATGKAVTKELPIQSAPVSGMESAHIARPRGDKFSLITDVKPQVFYDLVGQVVKIYPTFAGDVDLYITDYTSNSLLPHHASPDETSNTEAQGRYGDEFGYMDGKKQNWQGPYGNMTLKVELRQPHAMYAQYNTAIGDFVALQNVRIKTDGRGNLEGNIFPDHHSPERVLIEKVVGSKNEKVRNAMVRKEQYENSLGTSKLLKASTKKLSEKTKKKKKKQQQKDERRKAEAALRHEEGKILATLNNYDQGNQHVQCANRSVELTSITQIVDSPYLQERTPSGIERTLPFINVRYRSRIRVVDFHPQTLEDFAHSYDDAMYNDAENSEIQDADSMEIDVEPKKKWEWAFFLLVEDARQLRTVQPAAKLKLLVAGSDAEGLLKLDATDLRKDEETFLKLREKLFILWGDLEEVKAKAAAQGTAADSALSKHGASGFSCSSRPFECCIMEYGVPTESHEASEEAIDPYWTRMHKMFGTTIMDG